MQKIIQESKHLTNYEKDILCGLFDNLQRHQKDLFDTIQTEVKGQMQRAEERGSNWKIVTALINKQEVKEAKKNGFYEIYDTVPFQKNISYADLLQIQDKSTLEEWGDAGGTLVTEKYSAGITFLKCTYSKIENIIERKYTGKMGEEEVTYYLKPFHAYKTRELMLEQTARQCEIDGPILFSPMSRRAVNVMVDLEEKEISKADNPEIDFQLEKNGLADILQYNKTLIWNVEIIEENKIPKPRENVDKRIVPLFENVYLLYEFPVNNNEYIYIQSHVSDIKRYKNSVYVNLCENQSIDDIRYSKIERHDITNLFLETIEEKYENFYEMKRTYKERIRTEADIDYVLEGFSNSAVRYLGISRQQGSLPAVRIYEERDKYYYPKNKVFRSSAICYVKFAQSEFWLFEDYISYILGFMNYYYPEFYWVGVVA